MTFKDPANRLVRLTDEERNELIRLIDTVVDPFPEPSTLARIKRKLMRLNSGN